jgi:hypothetical protein
MHVLELMNVFEHETLLELTNVFEPEILLELINILNTVTFWSHCRRF